ncbi:MAG TPA: M48 family metalloprotease [Ilumatobacteraceae bacterium]|nr:M48 family metalloprotease [Ilumatobacteraceae bacterium]
MTTRTSPSARRNLDASAVSAMAPVVAVLPVWLLAITVWWLPFRSAYGISLPVFAGGYLAAGIVLFLRPVQQWVLAPLLGARRPTHDEVAVIAPAWRPVLQMVDIPSNRYVVAVMPSNELNAFACGGHLVVVTTYALDALPRDELSGVLAHELSHHLGLHTVALTIGQWLSLPVQVLARVGFFLQNVASAATDSFARGSTAATAIGRLISGLLTAVSWVFLAGLGLQSALANAVGHSSELQADQRAVDMGFGRPLAMALRRVIAEFGDQRPTTWRARLEASHPPARTRIARIEALLRRHANGER